MVTRLYNSRGRHIANIVSGRLHATGGRNIGHPMQDGAFFIDMRGRYLGEIVGGNRLMSKRSSPHRNINYGSRGNYGNVGNYGNPGNIGSSGTIAGYDDVPEDLLG